jgi:hypothetical protein
VSRRVRLHVKSRLQQNRARLYSERSTNAHRHRRAISSSGLERGTPARRPHSPGTTPASASREGARPWPGSPWDTRRSTGRSPCRPSRRVRAFPANARQEWPVSGRCAGPSRHAREKQNPRPLGPWVGWFETGGQSLSLSLAFSLASVFFSLTAPSPVRAFRHFSFCSSVRTLAISCLSSARTSLI